jgi:hypothetical protein
MKHPPPLPREYERGGEAGEEEVAIGDEDRINPRYENVHEDGDEAETEDLFLRPQPIVLSYKKQRR